MVIEKLGKNMLKKVNGNKLLVLIAFIIFIILLSYNLKVIANPFQNEYREAEMELYTNALQKGINIYAPASQPQYTNVYGIVYNLVLYPLYQLFGDSLAIGRIVSLIFILLSCSLIYLVCRKLKISKAFAICASILFYAAMLEKGLAIF